MAWKQQCTSRARGRSRPWSSGGEARAPRDPNLASHPAGLAPRRASHALGGDCVAAGPGRQVGGEDQPQGAAGWGGGGLLRAAPVHQQPHQELAGPGYSEGWRRPLSPGPAGGHRPSPLVRRDQGARHRPARWDGPAHPAASCASTASVTCQMRVSGGEAPLWWPSRTGLPPPLPRGAQAHLVDAEHGAPEGAAQPPQLGPQRLQTPGPAGRVCAGKLAAERGCHRVDDQQAGHTPRQQHRHFPTHAVQQGVLEAGGGAVTACTRGPAPVPYCFPAPSWQPGPLLQRPLARADLSSPEPLVLPSPTCEGRREAAGGDLGLSCAQGHLYGL